MDNILPRSQLWTLWPVRVWGEVKVRTYGEDDDSVPLQYDGHCTTTRMISTPI
jgi:hypothetical protein